MEKGTARRIDSLLDLLFSVLAGIMLRLWMHRWEAGVFGYLMATALFNIGWSIEYGKMNYRDL